jgi:hypothetical protein
MQLSTAQPAGPEKDSWSWLWETLAARLGPAEAAAIKAEYNQRADLDERQVLTRRYQRKIAEALARFEQTQFRGELKTIERYQRRLDQLAITPGVNANSAALRFLEVGGES